MSNSRKYICEFTAYRSGVHVPAKVEIFDRSWTGSYSTVNAVGMADPAVLTWDKVELTDCLQGAQLAVNLLAEYDGQYRDILDMDRPSAVLYISNSVFWKGVLATKTWIEPFVRERNYSVTITFSDFNYLDRLQFDKDDLLVYTSSFPMGSHPGDCGIVRLGDFLDYAVAGLGISDSEINYSSDLPLSGFGTTISNYLIHYNIFENAGDPMTLKQCLEALLEPICCRCVQYGGRLRIYRVNTMPTSYAGPVVAAGTDATLEAAARFKKIELSYNQSWHGALTNEPESVDAKIGDPYYQSGGVVFLAGDRYEPGKKGVKAISLQWGEDADKFLLAVANGEWVVPSGASVPAVDREMSWGDIVIEDYACLTTSFDICQGYDDKAADGAYPSNNTSVSLKFGALVSTTNYPFGVNPIDSNIRFIQFRARVTAHSDLLQPRYLVSETNTPVPTSGWRNTSGWFRIAQSVAGTPEFFTEGGWKEITEYISLPPGYTRITVDLYPVPYAVTNLGGIDSDAAPLRYSGIKDLSIEAGTSVDETLIGNTNTRRSEFDKDGDDYDKTFTFGIPTALTPFTDSAYRIGSTESTSGDTLLDRWMTMLVDNFCPDNACRYIVKGTYRYPHNVGITPRFSLSGIFQSLSESGAFLMMRSESWHVRSGDSDLELEISRSE